MTFNYLTHNGKITIENVNRGTHKTLKIRTIRKDASWMPGARILSVKVDKSYIQFAFVEAHGVRIWRNKHAMLPDQEKRLREALVDMLTNPKKWENRGFKFTYASTCRMCNKELTTPESIRSGIGPVCASK